MVWRVLALIPAVLVLFIVLLCMYRAYRQSEILKKSRAAVSPNGICMVEPVTIGGIKQYILIESKDVRNPVFLMLHGGPGMPVPYGVSARSGYPEIAGKFTLVFWDQRGSGKSCGRGIAAESINVEQFVSDVLELTDVLRERFSVPRIFLFGNSWGSIIGLSAAARYPQKYYAYVGLSQILNWAECDRLAYRWALDEARRVKNRKALKELCEVGEPPYLSGLRQWQVLRTWLMRLGGYSFGDEHTKSPGTGRYMVQMFFSPDYKLMDIWNMFTRGMKLSYNDRIIKEFSKIDLSSCIDRLDLPVFFIHGVHDKVASPQLLLQFLDKLTAPFGKELVWLEKSAHFINPDDDREIERVICQDMLNARVEGG